MSHVCTTIQYLPQSDIQGFTSKNHKNFENLNGERKKQKAEMQI